MYMKSINDLKTEMLFELQKANNNKPVPEVFGVQIATTDWPNVITVTVQFKDNKGMAYGMCFADENGTWKLLAPFSIKMEDKKK